MKAKIFTKRLLYSFLTVLITFTLILGFTKVKPVCAKTEHNPVVFVHGLGGASYNFVFIENYLLTQGWSRNELFAVDLPDKVLDPANNFVNSAVLNTYIDNVLKSTGKSKVDIVAHSMGGANSLYYINYLKGVNKVDKLVTLGGANGLVTSTAPKGVAVTSIYSSNDMVVANYLSYLNGANNIRISGVGHIGLLANNTVNTLIVRALK
ncbi:alpha/beta fold hydrolase [Clostridium sp. P21]|uniref:Alpha/beta fold hydrolase n=1 Tax=Clostridium muellerianum TaxID=2716538 RepID=A0A7Y0HQN5_9CLOT|nr:alpha/beta fold hydrolase [Clostridium muellerianum]NMM63993.1 alpha/beta fold hydrolase [Clostridium muellerianum]